MTQAYAPADTTTPKRHRERMSYERPAVHEVVDEALYCTLAFLRDGQPVSLPTMHARIGETVYVHGSTGGRFALLDGEPVSLSITVLDALVLARSWMHHSMGFRSVVAHARARVVRDADERTEAMKALIDKMYPGRSTDSRPPSAKEDAATAVIALELVEAGLKQRGGQVSDDEEDLGSPCWAGTIPLTLTRGTPRPAEDLAAGIELPAALRRPATGDRALKATIGTAG